MQDVEYIITLWYSIGDMDAGRGVYSHSLLFYWSLMSIFSLSGILLAIGMQTMEYILNLWHSIGDRDAGRGVYSHPLAFYWR
jgi:hypothetical protein